MCATRTLATDLHTAIGQTVTVQGWIHRRRRLASVSFAIIRDRTGLAQVVVRDAPVKAMVEALSEESVVEVTGTVTANPQAPDGVEVVDPSFRPLTAPAATTPVELWRPRLAASLPVMLDHASVTLRHPRTRATFEIAAAAVAGFRSTLSSDGFIEINTPKLVASATEGGATVFQVDYFGRPAYLAQSPQFYKQAMVGVFERVFEVGPVFRAEPHDTARHLAEYVSLDAELGFIEDHRDVMGIVRDTVAGMVDTINTDASPALVEAEVDLPPVPPVIPSVHFTEALRLVEGDGDEQDLDPEQERELGRWARREHDSDFVFVTGYPMAKRPFYTHADPADPRWSNSFDLLFRGVELVTGGQRLHRHDDYVDALAARGQSLEPYHSYLETFRYGMPPHGGFAIGLERFIASLVQADNIREVTLFPRDLHRLAP